MTSSADPATGVTLLFGASRGLGLALAREFGRRGHRLVITAREADELDRAADDLRGRGYDVSTDVGDVSDPAAVEATVRRVEQQHGPIEVTVVVAGIIQVGPLDALQRSDFVEAIDVMLWGPINAALAVLPGMRERRRGRIGVITSIGGLLAAPHLLPYSTAKFGAVGFARGLRSELVGSGVTVTTVAPGLMRTGSHLRARFAGQPGAEYGWFGPASALPVLSIDADRAAVIIADGVLHGRSTVLITPLAQIASRVAGAFPSLTAGILSITTWLLPLAGDDPSRPIDGADAHELVRPWRRSLLDRLTRLNDRAAGRFGQSRS